MLSLMNKKNKTKTYMCLVFFFKCRKMCFFLSKVCESREKDAKESSFWTQKTLFLKQYD